MTNRFEGLEEAWLQEIEGTLPILRAWRGHPYIKKTTPRGDQVWDQLDTEGLGQVTRAILAYEKVSTNIRQRQERAATGGILAEKMRKIALLVTGILEKYVPGKKRGLAKVEFVRGVVAILGDSFPAGDYRGLPEDSGQGQEDSALLTLPSPGEAG